MFIALLIKFLIIFIWHKYTLQDNTKLIYEQFMCKTQVKQPAFPSG